MKKYSVIWVLLLSLLSVGQQAVAFSGSTVSDSVAEILPVHHDDTASYPPSSPYLLNGSAQSETIFYHSNRPAPQFSENNSKEDDIRERVQEGKSNRERKERLYQADIIKRSLTFRELIYPHHFYF